MKNEPKKFTVTNFNSWTDVFLLLDYYITVKSAIDRYFNTIILTDSVIYEEMSNSNKFITNKIIVNNVSMETAELVTRMHNLLRIIYVPYQLLETKYAGTLAYSVQFFIKILSEMNQLLSIESYEVLHGSIKTLINTLCAKHDVTFFHRCSLTVDPRLKNDFIASSKADGSNMIDLEK